MPALPDVLDTLRIDYVFTIGEDQVGKVHQYWNFTGGSATPAELNTFANNISTAFNTHLIPLITPDRSLTSVMVTDLTSPSAARGEDSTAHVGTRMQPTLTGDICTLISNEILRRFRGGHCREYWPFGSEADLADPQTWLDAYVNEVDGDRGAFDVALIAAAPAPFTSIQQVSVSYYSGFTVHTGVTGRARNVSTVRATPLVDLIVNRIVRKGLATQRKRLLHIA